MTVWHQDWKRLGTPVTVSTKQEIIDLIEHKVKGCEKGQNVTFSLRAPRSALEELLRTYRKSGWDVRLALEVRSEPRVYALMFIRL
jgi:hypothetical protein